MPRRRAVLLEVFTRDVLRILAAQLAAGETVDAAVASGGVSSRQYTDNVGLWNDVLHERLWPTATVILRHFWLSEWLPQCPGLFHTDRARTSRRAARAYRLTDDSEMERLAGAAGRRVSDRALQRLRTEGVVVYLPAGKARMVEGGVGCLRLRPRRHDGRQVWFLGASSNGFAHEGIIVALEQEHAERVIGEIRRSGAVQCTMRGRLAYLPRQFDPLYARAVGVPQLHLEVDRLDLERPAQRGTFQATGAVLVRSDGDPPTDENPRRYEMARGIGAAYVSFDPGSTRSIAHACEWLATAYADGVMGGTVITDFDEHVRRFPGATFALEAIRDGTVLRPEVDTILDRLDLPGVERLQVIERLEIKQEFKGDFVAGDQYNISGQAGAAGRGAHAEQMSFLQVGVTVPDAAELAQDLAQLRTHLRGQAVELEHEEALGLLAAAERAARDGDADDAVNKLSGLRRLRRAGPWALGAATSIGTGVVAGVLRGVIGS